MGRTTPLDSFAGGEEKTDRDGLRRRLDEVQPWGIDAVDVTGLWNQGTPATMKICIVDTGYDLGHGDLPDPSRAGESVTGWDPSTRRRLQPGPLKGQVNRDEPPVSSGQTNRNLQGPFGGGGGSHGVWDVDGSGEPRVLLCRLSFSMV